MKSRICATCNKEFLSKKTVQIFCNQTCIRRTQEFKEKLRNYRTGRISAHRGKKLPHRSGANCRFWKGGVSGKNRTERQNFESTVEYRQFRREVFARDKYTCQICGDTTYKGHKIKIQLDHIKPFSLFPELRMDKTNVRTVCVPCHYKTDTYGTKIAKYKVIHNSTNASS